MNKNRIRGIWRRASWQLTTKPISIKDAGCKFGGCALNAVELTSGDLFACREFTTEVVVRQLDLAAEVSREHNNHDSAEDPNRDRE